MTEERHLQPATPPVQQFSLVPKTLDEACRLAEIMAKSNLVPSEFRGKNADILVAVQMGLEVGLPPMQAMQSICVINGKPSLWGDGMLAIVMSHRDYEWHKETKDPSGQWAECTIKRRNNEPHTVRFTMEMAGRAGLTRKAGPWTQYPERMLQMRARAWAFRDKFADALKGLQVAEEMKDVIEVESVRVAEHPLARTLPRPAPRGTATFDLPAPTTPKEGTGGEAAPASDTAIGSADVVLGARPPEDAEPAATPEDPGTAQEPPYSLDGPPPETSEGDLESFILFHGWRAGVLPEALDNVRRAYRTPEKVLGALQKTKATAARVAKLRDMGFNEDGMPSGGSKG